MIEKFAIACYQTHFRFSKVLYCFYTRFFCTADARFHAFFQSLSLEASRLRARFRNCAFHTHFFLVFFFRYLRSTRQGGASQYYNDNHILVYNSSSKKFVKRGRHLDRSRRRRK